MDIFNEQSQTSSEVDSVASTPEYTPKKVSQQQSDEKTKTVEVHTIPLAQYLPLGCFTFAASRVAKTLSSAPATTWTEATEFLPEVSDPEIPWKPLVELWRAHWIRIVCSPILPETDQRTWRIHILPFDVARSAVNRDNTKLRKALSQILECLDVSSKTWSGEKDLEYVANFDPWAAGEDISLFYLFNTLPSPAPNVEVIKDPFAQTAMHEILSSNGQLRGLRTPLYPYQKRSAAMMLQREVAPQLELDPRLEPRIAPTGEKFYYGARDCILLQNPRFYDSVRGGILAETMGLGKTLMCIALILSTRGHWPKIPFQYSEHDLPLRPTVGSLVDIAAAAVSRNGIPWRKVFEDIRIKQGLDMGQCVKAMEKQVPTYEIPPRPIRSNRSSTFLTASEQVRLCSGTLVVVPRNLVHQWQSELAKHVIEGTLKVLVMTSPKVMLPPPSELAKYDIILFSRNRFESEAKKITNDSSDWYESPLKGLHWLRIIIDEGHSFSSSNTNASVVAERLVRAERRWIVSGTPAKDLLGVEVEMETMTFEGEYDNVLAFRQKSLDTRKGFSVYQETSSGAIKSLGGLASNFLKAEPWASSVVTDDSAKWEDYIYRHEGYNIRTHTSFSACLRRTLESLVIKTRPEDVEIDIELPPLSHKIVRLDPSFYDKLTANLFVLLFTSNAVTSERTDVDYLFHKGSSMHLHRLVSNLRQSGFYWTGFNTESVSATLDITRRYLQKEGTRCNEEDRDILNACINSAMVALESPYWSALSASEEMGLFMADWPVNAMQEWAFTDCSTPTMIGLTQTIQAQRYINNNLSSKKPGEGLASAGTALKAEQEQAAFDNVRIAARVVTDSTKMEKRGIPATNFHTDQTRLSVSGVANNKTVRKPVRKPTGGAEMQPEKSSPPEKQKRCIKRRISVADTSIDLAADSDLGRTCITGTTSRKFSYLLDRILELHVDEKILIFFDANHHAYYLSQALDLFGIKHLIYANTLTNEQRGKYIVLFNTDPGHRVLLMDIKQAAHGLNLSSASRVFFINPVCRPGIEAQAIKRAHRIGQTRPVYVETLILKSTVEEAIHDRASNMTRYEHMQASRFLEDDATITRIIQQARVLPLGDEHEREDQIQMALLSVPQQLFGRPGRGGAVQTGLEKELFGDGVEHEDDGEMMEKRAEKRQRTAKSRIVNLGRSKGKQKQSAVVDEDSAPHSAGEELNGFNGTSSSIQTYDSIFGGG